ncbi:hypothetical protein KAM92_000007 [Salmonella enterica subsp. enterica serovar Glostrup]|nr:hypothetical protein [Salmonella enterica subsp. enterica serovar Glostrup]EKO4976925.1 hypothetical protein [Salmonella enterica]ELC6653073.1 hypothetical protein [Salmonella enterica]
MTAQTIRRNTATSQKNTTQAQQDAETRLMALNEKRKLQRNATKEEKSA